ncbi:MAG TPA: LysR family transcriptional regulator [Bryobacteraceae bacterium]|jgi:LysR family hydrogen peroxide-inducible transcriptional activator
MEIHQLRYFCAVAQTGSFTKAATQEGIAQPSLSQQILRLESDLGSKLFDRLGRGVQLTEFGRALLPEALQILRQVNGARATLESLRLGVAGRLAVGCIPTITPYFLAPNLNNFAEKYPDVNLRLVEDITPKLLELLQSGEIDLAIVSPPVKSPDVVCSDLFREPILVAVGRRHRLAGESSVSLPELREEKLLLLKEGHCFRDNALTVCSRARTTFTSMFESNQFSSILPLVSAGFGISLVPRMAVQGETDCKFLPLEREAYRRIGYMRIRQHVLGTAQRTFLDWLRAISKDHVVHPHTIES